MRVRQIIGVASLLFVLLAGSANRVQAGLIWNADADFDAGWATGANPNGVWSYGWTPYPNKTSGFTLFTAQAYIYGGRFEQWYSPSNEVGFTPLVYKNISGLYNDGNIDIPAGALIMHGGGNSGSDYSHVIWTAPSSGSFTVSAAFTMRQQAFGPLADVYVFDDGQQLFSGLVNFDGDRVSYNGQLTLSKGDTMDFVVGQDGTGLHAGSTQLDATIEAGSAVPEPSGLVLFVIGCISFALSRHRRRQS